jgi:hypothetical protein
MGKEEGGGEVKNSSYAIMALRFLGDVRNRELRVEVAMCPPLR